MPDVIVFDLDGVLVDVRRSFPQAIVRAVASLGGGTVTAAQMRALKHAGGFNNDWDLSLELLRQRGIAVERERVVDVFNRFYLGPRLDGEGGLILEETWLLPGPQLERLRQRCLAAIFTGRPRADAEFSLRHFGVAEFFPEMVAMEDVAEQKPHPEGLLRLRGRFAPGRILAYIGDTVDDARCAAAAGVPFIGILPWEPELRAEAAAHFQACASAATAVHVAEAIELAFALKASAETP